MNTASNLTRNEKKRIADEKYRRTHREEIKRYRKQYYIDNQERLRQYKKVAAPKVNVVCTECQRLFSRRRYEFNRTERKGGKHFCNSSCRTKHFNKHLTPEQIKMRDECILSNRYTLKSDALSPFRVFSKRVRQADVIKKYGQPDIDVEYLKRLWEFQDGRCGYTGIKMILPPTIREYHKTHSVKKISLDRIDSSKGYIKGNVHFTCQAINLAKRNLPHEDMMALIQEIKNAEMISAFNKNGGPARERSGVSEIINS